MTGVDGGPIRVLVVDDQPLERTGIALILDSDDEIEVIGEAGDGAEAVASVAADPPDVVLMDVRMPGMNGIEATRIIAASHPEVRTIVLTTFDLDEYAFGSLRAGASAFLLKSTKPKPLVDAVKVVVSGASVVDPRVTTKLIEHFFEGASASAGAGVRAGIGAASERRGGEASHREPGDAASRALRSLSPRERQIFEAIVRGLSNPEISAELVLAPSTIKSHVNSIFAKLGLRDRVHAVILGYELGLAPRR